MNISLIILAVRTVKLDMVKQQLLKLLELETEDILALPTNYGGITLLNIDASVLSNLSSIRNIEALVLDGTAAAQLLKPTMACEAPSFVLLDSVDEIVQYEHLSQLLQLHMAFRDQR